MKKLFWFFVVVVMAFSSPVMAWDILNDTHDKEELNILKNIPRLEGQRKHQDRGYWLVNVYENDGKGYLFEIAVDYYSFNIIWNSKTGKMWGIKTRGTKGRKSYRVYKTETPFAATDFGIWRYGMTQTKINQKWLEKDMLSVQMIKSSDNAEHGHPFQIDWHPSTGETQSGGKWVPELGVRVYGVVIINGMDDKGNSNWNHPRAHRLQISRFSSDNKHHWMEAKVIELQRSFKQVSPSIYDQETRERWRYHTKINKVMYSVDSANSEDAEIDIKKGNPGNYFEDDMVIVHYTGKSKQQWMKNW